MIEYEAKRTQQFAGRAMAYAGISNNNLRRGKGVDEMIVELLDMDIVIDNTVVFTAEAKKLIHEIAMRCEKAPVFVENMDRVAEYGKDLSAEEVFVDMVYKIIAAPSTMHRIMSARMLIPVIDQKLVEVQIKD